MSAANPPRRLLIADDFPGAAASLALVLQRELPAGCIIDVATDGLEAIDRALEHRPDVAVLDIEMPGADGIIVADAIKSMHRGHRVVCIALTGGSVRLRMDVEASGLFKAVLTKPADFNQLVALICPSPLGEEGRAQADSTVDWACTPDA